MEGDEQRRRRYEQPNYPRGYAHDYEAQGSNVSNLQHLRGVQVDDNADRFRQGQHLTTRTPVATPLTAAAGTGSLQDLGAMAYSQGQQYPTPQMQAPQFSYQPDYLQDPQRQRFPPYPAQVYNVPQPPLSQSPYHAPQQPLQQSPYDHLTQLPPRQTAGVEELSNQFGGPSQYYSAADASNALASAGMHQGYPTTAFQQHEQYTASQSLGRSTLASSYPVMPLDSNQTGSVEGHLENEPDVAVEIHDRIHRAIGETNQNTSRGMLVQAANHLMKISDWFLENAFRLGFTRDDQSKHAHRLAVWDNFNNCWLALLQRQLDETQRRLATGRSPIAPQNILPAETLEDMGNRLVAHCDSLGKFGLVDYQMGVSEEEIIAILNRCLDLLKTDDEDSTGAEGMGQRPNLPGQRRGNP